jgi:hypothetical protein
MWGIESVLPCIALNVVARVDKSISLCEVEESPIFVFWLEEFTLIIPHILIELGSSEKLL